MASNDADFEVVEPCSICEADAVYEIRVNFTNGRYFGSRYACDQHIGELVMVEQPDLELAGVTKI